MCSVNSLRLFIDKLKEYFQRHQSTTNHHLRYKPIQRQHLKESTSILLHAILSPLQCNQSLIMCRTTRNILCQQINHHHIQATNDGCIRVYLNLFVQFCYEE